MVYSLQMGQINFQKNKKDKIVSLAFSKTAANLSGISPIAPNAIFNPFDRSISQIHHHNH